MTLPMTACDVQIPQGKQSGNPSLPSMCCDSWRPHSVRLIMITYGLSSIEHWPKVLTFLHCSTGSTQSCQALGASLYLTLVSVGPTGWPATVEAYCTHGVLWQWHSAKPLARQGHTHSVCPCHRSPQALLNRFQHTLSGPEGWHSSTAALPWWPTMAVLPAAAAAAGGQQLLQSLLLLLLLLQPAELLSPRHH